MISCVLEIFILVDRVILLERTHLRISLYLTTSSRDFMKNKAFKSFLRTQKVVFWQKLRTYESWVELYIGYYVQCYTIFQKFAARKAACNYFLIYTNRIRSQESHGDDVIWVLEMFILVNRTILLHRIHLWNSLHLPTRPFDFQYMQLGESKVILS